MEETPLSNEMDNIINDLEYQEIVDFDGTVLRPGVDFPHLSADYEYYSNLPPDSTVDGTIQWTQRIENLFYSELHTHIIQDNHVYCQYSYYKETNDFHSNIPNVVGRTFLNPKFKQNFFYIRTPSHLVFRFHTCVDDQTPSFFVKILCPNAGELVPLIIEVYDHFEQHYSRLANARQIYNPFRKGSKKTEQ